MLDAPMGDAPRETVFTRHDAARGLEWMRQSYGLFRRARVPWVALVLCYYIVLLVINLLPYVGGIGAMVVRPVFAVGFLAAAWNQERGARPSPRHLFQGFRSNLWVLVPLGVLIIVNIAIAMGATSLVDGGRLVGVLMNPAPEGLDADERVIVGGLQQVRPGVTVEPKLVDMPTSRIGDQHGTPRVASATP